MKFHFSLPRGQTMLPNTARGNVGFGQVSKVQDHASIPDLPFAQAAWKNDSVFPLAINALSDRQGKLRHIHFSKWKLPAGFRITLQVRTAPIARFHRLISAPWAASKPKTSALCPLSSGRLVRPWMATVHLCVMFSGRTSAHPKTSRARPRLAAK